MKKVFRVFLITIGLILLLIIVLPIFFKARIEDAVKAKINEDIHAYVDWAEFSLSFFRGFPDLSINLHQVSVVGKSPFEGDTLAGLDRFELRVNPFSAISKDIQVKSILIDRPGPRSIPNVSWGISTMASPGSTLTSSLRTTSALG